MPIQRWQTKPPLGVRLNPGHPLSRGLIGAWLMNEGTGPSGFNSVRSGPDLVVNGAASLNGQGFNVTGVSTSFGNAAYNAAYDSTALTVVTCFSMPTVPAAALPTLIAKTDTNSNNGFNIFVAQPSGSVVKVSLKANGGSNLLNINGVKQVDDGKKHVVAMCLNGILPATVYVDGVIDIAGTPTGSWDFIANGTRPIRWGVSTDSFWNPEPETHYWTYWYNRVLSQSEVIALQYDPYAMFQRPMAMGSDGVIPAEILCSMWGPSYPDLLFDRLGVVAYGEI